MLTISSFTKKSPESIGSPGIVFLFHIQFWLLFLYREIYFLSLSFHCSYTFNDNLRSVYSFSRFNDYNISVIGIYYTLHI